MIYVAPKGKQDMYTDLKLALWLIVDVNFVFVLLHHVVLGDVADVSEINAISIFRIRICRLVSLCVYIIYTLQA
jgi:uncharacterized Tic20 family protein